MDLLEDHEGALRVTVPLYHYPTLYAHLGDGLVIGIALFVLLLAYRLGFFRKDWH